MGTAVDYDDRPLWREIWRVGGLVEQLRAEVRRLAAQLPAAAEVLEDGTLRRAEAARFLGLRPSTLNRMATRGDGPPYIKFRGATYYRMTDLERWRQVQTRRGRAVRPKNPAGDLLPLE